MKLNEQSKNELRKEIEEAVKRVPEGQRIHLDKELLDELIFFKYKDENGLQVKFPVWTGEFLRKIDLSEISFENCILKSSFLSPNVRKKIERFLDENVNGYTIDFSYTNINIDFSKCYDLCGCMERVNLEGVDLSKSNILSLDNYELGIINCNFSNCNLTVIPTVYRNGLPIDFTGTNFSNNKLSGVVYDLNYFLNYHFNSESQNIRFFNYGYPNFSNTGINFSCDFNNYSRSNLFKYIIKGFLDGCYLNGKLIDSTRINQNKSNKQSLFDEYKIMEEGIFTSTLGSIEDQIKGFKG